MLQSMTGFGAASGQIQGVSYAVEVRSVNNRYLKVSLKLPDYLAHVENDVEQLLRARCQRGTVTLYVQMRLPEDRAAATVNTAVLSSYLDQLRPLEVQANPMLRVDLAAMMSLPGVCEPPAVDELVEATRPGLMDLVGQALDALVAMRRKEGQAVEDDLLGNCEEVEKGLAEVARLAPQVVVDYQERLTRRVQELLRGGNVRVDEDQLIREVAIFADRCDIAEEIARLGGHVVQFRHTVALPEPAGRKLDFIAQEMLREANTIGSKANSGEIVRAVVDIKTAIDRIKEQVQNVE